MGRMGHMGLIRGRITLAALLTVVLCSALGAYQNPLVLPKDGEGPGIADPGLLKWMGKYYLYATKTEEQGVRCWESADLVRWKFRGYCTGDEPTFAGHMAWSPTPVYRNGKFYLIVCGIDQKHQAFEADRPWGPFKCVNKDLINVNTLDASPFVDDDGQLYLFYAGWGGNAIQYRKCSSPTKADGPNQKLPACQFSVQPNNYWTEGPSVFKYDGVYYLTYCGNDWGQDNYQVRVSKGRSIEELKPQSNEPLIAQLTGTWRATGCNWMIMGPDLKSLWNVYHCRKGGSWERRLCLDRLYIVPKTRDLWTNGPTWDSQANPATPLWWDDFARQEIGANWESISGKWRLQADAVAGGTVVGSGKLECKVPTKDSFAVEANIRLISGKSNARYGMTLCSSDELTIDVRAKQLMLTRDGSVIARAALPASTDLNTWHTVRVDKQASRLRVYFDEMLKIDMKAPNAGAGRFGLMASDCTTAFGWCGFSNYGADDGIEKMYVEEPN